MLTIHKQAQAEQDLIKIWKYSHKEWGVTQADKYLDELGKAFALIAQNPSIGVSCEEVRKGYRKYYVKRHLIMYRTSKTTLHPNC